MSYACSGQSYLDIQETHASGLRKRESSKYDVADFIECVKDEMLPVNDHMFQKSSINHYCVKHKT